MYHTLFFRSRLVPRWLSGWGVFAAMLMMTARWLAMFSNRQVTGYTLVILPIAVQEMVLAVWLLVKGFSLPPLTDGASAESETALSVNASTVASADAPKSSVTSLTVLSGSSPR